MHRLTSRKVVLSFETTTLNINVGIYLGKPTKKLTSRVIIDLIFDDNRNMPGITPRDVQSPVKDKFGVEISYYVAWRSTKAGRNLIFGDHSKSYSYLPAYFAEAERTNPDSIFNLDLHPQRKNFRHCLALVCTDLNSAGLC